MGRRARCRRVGYRPLAKVFRPVGLPMGIPGQVRLTVCEFEAIRLHDFEEMRQEDAAKRMGVSRQTFGRMLCIAHKKVAECFVMGKTLFIEGGNYSIIQKSIECQDCGFVWGIPFEFPLPPKCPECGGVYIRKRGGSYGRGFRGKN